MRVGALLRILLTLLFFVYAPTFSQNEYNSLSDDLKLLCNRETAYSTGVSDARKGLARKEDYAQICKVNREFLNAAYNSGYNFGLTNQGGIVVNEPAPNHPEIETQLPSSQTSPYTRPLQTEQNPYLSQDRNVYGGRLFSTAPAGANGFASTQPAYPSERGVTTGDLARPEPIHGLKQMYEVTPSLRPKCIESENGNQACGYNCVNSAGNVRCAATPDQYCKGTLHGQIACGYHCVQNLDVVRCALVPSDICVSDHNGHVHCGVNCRVQGNAEAVCDFERYAP